MKKIYAVLSIILISFSLQAFSENFTNPNDNIKGTWLGKLKIPGHELRIVFNIKEDGSGNLTATMQSPDQTPKVFPVDTVIYSDGNIKLEVKFINGYFEGKFNPDSLIITGNWHQGGQFLPLTLRKTGEIKEAEQLQKPSTSSLFNAENVSIIVNGYKLNGTLQVPKSNKPVDVVLIIAGSGPTDRDGNTSLISGKNNSLKMLADTLFDNGIASLRYDKRGIGANEKVNEADLTFNMYVNDAEEWVKYLKKDKRFANIIIAGHSEGSLIGMIAAGHVNVEKFISLCGAGRPAYDVIDEQLKNSELPDAALKNCEVIIDSLKLGYTVKDVPPVLVSLFKPSVQPYLISWFKYDPAKEIAKLSIPSLIVEGTTDIQVDVKDAEALSSAAKNGKLDIIKNMNHVLKDVPSLDRNINFNSYGNPDLPLSKALCKDVIEFIKQ